MNIAVDDIAISLFKKPLNECSADELQQLTHQYPYFGPGQLLLAKKISIASNAKADNLSIYDEQIQKASLYFPNRVWLHHLLNDTGPSEIVTLGQPAAKEEELLAETEQTNPGSFIEPVMNEYNQAEVRAETVKEELLAETEQSNPESFIEPVVNEHHQADETAEPVKAEFLAESEQRNSESFIEPAVNEHHHAEETTEPGKEEMMEQAEIAVALPELKIEPLPANTGLTFEPFHTVDYFASQGIKFREDETPKDRFSQQLKSFTEWLKTMKRIPPSQIIATNDGGIENKVEQLAEHSIAERHVITEAMAEVWIKQGNKAKAEEIYRKLSLLDPLKSSYFAARIEDLKKTS